MPFLRHFVQPESGSIQANRYVTLSPLVSVFLWVGWILKDGQKGIAAERRRREACQRLLICGRVEGAHGDVLSPRVKLETSLWVRVMKARQLTKHLALAHRDGPTNACFESWHWPLFDHES